VEGSITTRESSQQATGAGIAGREQSPIEVKNNSARSCSYVIIYTAYYITVV
jgi:hypothetical protein